MKHWNWILPLAVVTGIVLVIFCYVIPARENEREYEINKQLKDLKVNNELLEKSNQQLTTKVDVLHIEADSLQRLIQQDSTEILTLLKAKHEKMDAINDFTDDELFQFFAGFKTNSTANQ